MICRNPEAMLRLSITYFCSCNLIRSRLYAVNRLKTDYCRLSVRQRKVQSFHIHHLLVDPVNIHRALPFSFTALMFASESSVSSFAMNFPRTSLRRSKFIFRAGPTAASCITLILRKKRCCGLLCSSSVARCISTLVIATNDVALPDEICIPRNL